MKEIIRKALSVYAPITDATAALLSGAAEIVNFSEDEFLEQENNVIRNEFVVLEGIVRGYLLNSEGEDVTVNFYISGNAVTPAIMRGINNRSIYNLQVISGKARILVFNNMRMEDLMPYNADLQQFGNTIVMLDSMRRMEKEVLLLKETARGKLDWFRKIYPGLENKIQHYYIASYLGITPTSLSRVRGTSLS
jgi:CRP-like cAMP-binding protein